MTNITSLFNRFDQTPIVHYFSPAEINALITIGQIRGQPTDFFKELEEVTEYMQNLYHTESFDILENDIKIAQNYTWDKTNPLPIFEIKPAPREYHYSESELFTHIQTEYNVKKENLPKLLHSLYINQFISGFNDISSESFLTSPTRKEFQKLAMSSGSQTLLNLLEFETIQGFSETEIIGKRRNFK